MCDGPSQDGKCGVKNSGVVLLYVVGLFVSYLQDALISNFRHALGLKYSEAYMTYTKTDRVPIEAMWQVLEKKEVPLKVYQVD